MMLRVLIHESFWSKLNADLPLYQNFVISSDELSPNEYTMNLPSLLGTFDGTWSSAHKILTASGFRAVESCLHLGKKDLLQSKCLQRVREQTTKLLP
jgi:hypothetical protein